MKKVNFEKVTIENFLSVGNEPVEVSFDTGFHVITGKNIDKPDRRNAVGKSTIADAIYFGVFGDTLRELKKDMIPNNVTGGRACVALKFNVVTASGTRNYKVVRQLQPTKVFLYEDGIDITRDSIGNTNKRICEIVSATPAIFKNCVIMTINDTIPFMAKSKSEKRKFIEDIFGLEIFSKMITSIRSEYTEIKQTYDIQQVNITEARNSYNNYIIQRDSILDRRVKKRVLYRERKKGNLDERKGLLLQIDKIPELSVIELDELIDRYEKAIDKCDDKINDTSSDIAVKRSDAKQLKDTFTLIGTDEAQCPTCLKLIGDHDLEVIATEKSKLNASIIAIVDDIKELSSAIKDINVKKSRIKAEILKVNKKKQDNAINQQTKANKLNQIEQLDNWLDELEVDLKDVEGKDTDLDSAIAEADTNIKSLEKKNKEIRKELAKLDIVKYIVSEEGVKSYIVSKLLEVLNSRLIHYLQLLDSNSICMFNEYFEEEILNEKNKLCSYFNFSGAERKAIDLACLFTFSDIRRMQGDVQYNISIYDELFDSSFDNAAVELAINVLKERVETLDECILLISHRKETASFGVESVIYLEKQNGVTVRKEYLEVS